MKAITPADHASTVRELHPSLRQNHITPVSAPLHVIVAIFNPTRAASRYRLFEAFRKYIEDSGAVLTTVELALGDRHHEVTSRNNPNDVQVRSRSIMFLKENLLNIGWRHVVNRTDPHARYFGWFDGDVSFARPDWVAETIHKLQEFSVLQLWSNAINLGDHGQPIQHFSSFAHDWAESQHTLQPLGVDGKPLSLKRPPPNHHGDGYWHKPKSDPHQPAPWNTLETGMFHTGLAWAARREVLEGLGGLGDTAILGSGDHHMAWSFVGEVERSIHRMTSAGYQAYWTAWQERADRVVRQNLGYVDGTIIAGHHGAMQDRRYRDRWQILNTAAFDPVRDLITNSQGVYEWAGNKPGLARDVAHYFQLRREP